MTRALVVYESLFGDARAIARAVADGLASAWPADVVPAAEAPRVVGDDVRLLVVGGPNHALGMPRPSTRKSAVQQYGAAVADTGTGLREWLGVVQVPAGVLAAAFDTRGSGHPVLVKMDHAARTEERLLRKLGAELVAPPEHFSVVDAKGPLVEGEEGRAREWGATLARLAVTRAARAVRP